ncbi:MAG: hypothetical protein IJ370_00925, partial [Oscillospiraceae bacterium]|nr:hypothetical protein [Oscillospiraceae bacterium]
NQKMLSVWVAHIWIVFYFMPIAYDLAGSLNMAFCCNPVLECERNKGIRKKVMLNSFCRKLFYGYDACSNMLCFVLLYECFLFIYICIFILSNVIFIVELVTNSANLAFWRKLWIFEIVVQLVMFAIVMLSSYLKDIYLWSKEEKNKERSKVHGENMIKRDIEILKCKKIIKQKRENEHRARFSVFKRKP